MTNTNRFIPTARSFPAFLLAVALLPFFAAGLRADDRPRQKGIDVQKYSFRLEIRDDSDAISGTADIDCLIREDGLDGLWLDLAGPTDGGRKGMTVASVRAGDAAVAFRQEGDRLIISAGRPLKKGDRFKVTVAYSGVPSDGLIMGRDKEGGRLAFGDNFPDRAHDWLPVVDHPSDKAACEFEIIAPETYLVVANGALAETSSLSGGRRLTRYIESVPIPVYCMVIGVGRFAVEVAGRPGGVPVETWVYAGQRHPGFEDFRSAVKPLEFFEKLLGPFPYEKLANVQSRTRWGGSENAGAIFYYEKAVNGQDRNEMLFAHEIAHQWFGDSVTESDWDHTWLSEGFATYLTHVYAEAAKGPDVFKSGLRRDRDMIAKYYAGHPASAVVIPADHALDNILSVNSYQKGGWLLHMLRSLVGDDAFWKGLRIYYERFRFGNALTDDFRQAMEEASGKDLKTFFDQWALRPGQPELSGQWAFRNGTLTVKLRQVQAGAPFSFPVEIGVIEAAGREPAITAFEMTGSEGTFTVKLDRRPAGVVLDPNVKLLFKAGKFGPRP